MIGSLLGVFDDVDSEVDGTVEDNEVVGDFGENLGHTISHQVLYSVA